MNKYLILMLALAMVACKKNDDSKSSDEQLAPSASYKVIQKEELSESQKEEIKQIGGKFTNMPGAHLLIKDDKESNESKAAHQKEISKMSGLKKQIFDNLSEKCSTAISRPETEESSEEPGSKSNQTKSEVISGDSCPMGYFGTDNTEITTISSNMKELEAEYKKKQDAKVFDKLKKTFLYKMDSENETQVKTEDLQSQVGFKKSKTTAVGEGKSTYMKGASSSRYKMNGEIVVETLVGPTVKMNVMMDSLSSEGQKPDSYAEITMTYPSSSSTIQRFQKQDGEVKLYLNGQAVTEEQLKEIFGDMNFSN
ncbi:MAG: hypothetical protein ACAH59_02180 [Pseudobdellovibrionaceae bacterium]